MGVRGALYNNDFIWTPLKDLWMIRLTPSYGLQQNAGLQLKKLQIPVSFIHGALDLTHTYMNAYKLFAPAIDIVETWFGSNHPLSCFFLRDGYGELEFNEH